MYQHNAFLIMNSLNILNKSEKATHELFVIIIQNGASQ